MGQIVMTLSQSKIISFRNVILFDRLNVITSVTAINFILPLNLNTECEFEFTKKFEKDQIPIRHLSNQLNPNTNKLKHSQIRPNINEYQHISEKLRLNYSKILVSNHHFSVSIIFYCIYMQIYFLNVTQQVQNLQNVAMKMINSSFNIENSSKFSHYQSNL